LEELERIVGPSGFVWMDAQRHLPVRLSYVFLGGVGVDDAQMGQRIGPSSELHVMYPLYFFF